MKARYWSCTKLADKIRGTPKPDSASGKGWRDWRNLAKSSHPIRYWIAEEALDSIHDFIFWPFDKLYKIKYWLVNRYVTKTHALTSTSLSRGEWHEFEERLLFCLFDELVNFVEVEQAWHYVACDKEAYKKFSTPWYASGWFRLRTWRCPEAGLEHLDWASNLIVDENWGVHPSEAGYGVLTSQALAAREVVKLYHWWKTDRPNRADPYDASGWTEICNRRRIDNEFDWFGEIEDLTEKEESAKALQRLNNLELEYNQEDEEMLIRLIKIRHSLWT